MNNLFILEPHQIKSLYNSLILHKKDNIDMILEPLQSMIQLALLSVSQIGTKLIIQNNILYLQYPSFTQPISRWYNSDKKENLYYLFSVIKRFTNWYNPTVNAKSPININLYQLILKMSLQGLDNLIITYNTSQNSTIIQVIQMYRAIIEYGENFIDLSNNTTLLTYNNTASPVMSPKPHSIDNIFENIIEIYDENLIICIYNILLIIQNEKDNIYINNYIDGINNIMTKNNKSIHEWIKMNLII